jgi:hypothetical protein
MQFERIQKVIENEYYQFYETGYQFRRFTGSNSGKAHKGKSKTGDETPIRNELGEKTSLVPCFLSSVLFPSRLLISSQFQWYREPSRPVWRGTLHLTPVSYKR